MRVEVEIGQPPRSRRLGMPVSGTKGGEERVDAVSGGGGRVGIVYVWKRRYGDEEDREGSFVRVLGLLVETELCKS